MYTLPTKMYLLHLLFPSALSRWFQQTDHLFIYSIIHPLASILRVRVFNYYDKLVTQHEDEPPPRLQHLGRSYLALASRHLIPSIPQTHHNLSTTAHRKSFNLQNHDGRHCGTPRANFNERTQRTPKVTHGCVHILLHHPPPAPADIGT